MRLSRFPSPHVAGRQLLARLAARSGFRDEINFWRRELSLKGDSPEFVSSSLDPSRMETVYPTLVTKYVEELQHRFGRRPRVLDVGCGPSSLLSYGQHLGLIDLTGVDPLATEYGVELARNGQTAIGSMRRGFGENLSSMFESSSFDLVFMCNALDHAQSPAAVLASMCDVLQPGGVLFLQGYVREGSSNNFHGLHQHDLSLLADGRLMCRRRAWPLRRGGRSHCISDGLPLDLLEQTAPSEEKKTQLRVVYRRRC